MMVQEKRPGVCDLAGTEEPITFGTWVWDRKEIARPDDVLSFLTANTVNEIYLVHDPRTAAEAYKAFVRKATAAGVRVSLIGADARWVLPRGHEQGEEYLRFYADYQSAALGEERFYGMHLDIEPHQLPEWLSDNLACVQAYCDFVLRAREVADSTASELELDIPCWFDGFPCRDVNGDAIHLIEFCVRHADTTLFMSYRDSGRGAADFAKVGLETGKRYGKKVSLALETGRIYEDVNITFDHLGTAPLCRELAELRRIAEADYPGLQVGYAVHHYNSWVELPLEGHPIGEGFPYDNPHYKHLIRSNK